MTRARLHPPDFDVVTQWRLEARPEDLTGIVLDPDLIHLWCPSVFMASEVIERGRADGLGMTVRLYTKGWLPHSFIFTARIVDLVPHRAMTIAVDGDFVGQGTIAVAPDDDRHCTAELHWRTDVAHPYVRHFKRVLKPVFVWNHKWAMRKAHRLMQAELGRRRTRSGAFTTARVTFPHNIPAIQDWIRRRALRRDRSAPGASACRLPGEPAGTEAEPGLQSGSRWPRPSR